VGKIFNALEKYKKERRATTRPQKLKPSDYEALLQYDWAAGKLDLKHPLVIQDPGTVDRLMTYRLIEADGSLTPAGKAKYAELNGPEPKSSVSEPVPEPVKEIRRPQPEPISEWQEVETAVSETDIKILPPDNIIGDTEEIAEIVDKPVKEQVVVDIKDAKIIKPEAVEPRIVETKTVAPEPVPVKEKPPVKKAPAPKPSLPAFHNEKMDQNLVSFFNPQSFEAEQFKILRSNLLYPVTGNPPRSVMITSSMPGEGKSFVAANLAISVALNINRHVLLMDCDLRRPSIHSRFGFEDVPGLSDYLSNGVPLLDLLIRTFVDKLTILPSGQPPDNPSELLSSERMSELLAEATERYPDRLIILDSPPPALTAETSVLSRWVDGVIIVIKHGKTPRAGVSDVIDKIGKEKIIGAVMNNFEVYSSRYYGKYYGKGQGYK
jgi:protein-tyrosine kinase